MDSPQVSALAEALKRANWLLSRTTEGDLTEYELGFLAHVHLLADGRPLIWLANHLGIPRSTASARAKELEKRGYLVRSRAANDERRLVVALTPLGESVVAASSLFDLEAIDRGLRDLDGGERLQLIRLLNRVLDAAEMRPEGALRS